MIFEQRAFWLPKDVQAPNLYEDACGADPKRGIAVICDGVSSSLFSRRWAAILAQAIVTSPPPAVDPQAMEVWLKGCRKTWATAVDENALAWHQKPKLLEGAQTTLLWIQLSAEGTPETPPSYRMRAFSMGDCCLFHFRDNQFLGSFPLQNSSQFESNPRVVRSVHKRSDSLVFDTMETSCCPGDLLVLCTDAVAAWTMRQLEAGARLDWDAYWNLPVEQWQQWVIDLRQQNQIRYDDSTMMLIRIAAQSAPERQKASQQQAPEEAQGDLLDAAETRLRGVLKSAKGFLRKGLRDISESRWLDDDESK